MDRQRTLDIPFIAELNTEAIADVPSILHSLGSHSSIDNVNWASKYPYHPLTAFNTGHNGTHIFIDFFVRCNYLRAVNSTNNSPVSQDSCVEFFVAPHSDNHYYNFELNCIGAINASHRSERHNPTRLTNAELDSVIRFASCGNRPFNEVEGLFAWNVVVAIPLELIGISYTGKPIEMTGNFNKCASGTSQPHYLSWNPIDTPEPDFHQPGFFGKIRLL